MAGKKGSVHRSKIHLDMVWVYEHPDGDEGTPTQKLLRGDLKKDAGKFLARLERMESAYEVRRDVAEGKLAAGEGEEGPVDEGTEAALLHAERFLEGLKNESS